MLKAADDEDRTKLKVMLCQWETDRRCCEVGKEKVDAENKRLNEELDKLRMEADHWRRKYEEQVRDWEKEK